VKLQELIVRKRGGIASHYAVLSVDEGTEICVRVSGDEHAALEDADADGRPLVMTLRLAPPPLLKVVQSDSEAEGVA